MKTEEIKHLFTYHAPTQDSIERLQHVREVGCFLAEAIDRYVPDCADKSAAIRKLRECVMTANAGIVLNQNVSLGDAQSVAGYQKP